MQPTVNIEEANPRNYSDRWNDEQKNDVVMAGEFPQDILKPLIEPAPRLFEYTHIR